MRITDGGKYRRRGGEQRTGTVSRHGDAHYLCPQCRDINPLHLNARRARSASSLCARGVAEKKSTGGGKKGAEGGEGRRDTKSGFGSPHFETGSLEEVQSWLVQSWPLVPEFSGTSGARAARLPRSRGRARILHTGVSYLQ